MAWDGQAPDGHDDYEGHRPERRPTAGRIAAALAVLLLGMAVLGITLSDALRLTDVVVYCDDFGLAQEVCRAVRVPEGVSTFWYPLAGVRRDALTCSRVRTARVERSLPNRLIVRVAPRKPAFALETAQGVVVADPEGVLLFHSATPGAGLPRVSAAPQSLAVGQRWNPGAVTIVRQCMDGAKAGGLGMGFHLDIRTRFDYSLITPRGVKVKLGGGDNLKRKVMVAALVERHLRSRRERVAYIDVRVPQRDPVWMPVGAEEESMAADGTDATDTVDTTGA